MKTFCVRQGQVEIGVVEHEGQQFSAFGASVVGRHVTGYTRLDHGEISLTTWCGKTMLACRCEVVERYWSGSLALMFRLPRGRFLVGYALAENGMIFRGELLQHIEEQDARRMALRVSDHFAELDSEDEETFQSEQERLLDIEYRCPNCGHEWTEQWSCACDSECANCGTPDITASEWEEAE